VAVGSAAGDRVSAVTRVYPSPSAAGVLVYGAVGGGLGAAVSLAVLAADAARAGFGVLAAPNAVGAWLVRWLQTAAPGALAAFHVDATLGGALTHVAVGALVGAVFAVVLDRLPEDHPVAWGAMLGLGLWALARWTVPALDPVLSHVVTGIGLLVAHLAYGVLLGAWVDAGRGLGADPGAGAGAGRTVTRGGT
jgi:hypothetical protein